MNRISAMAALTAGFSLCATPAVALDLPHAGPAQVRPAYDAAAETVEHRRRHYRRGGVDAGDVIAGVLILGGIAAVASAASGSRDRSEPYPQRDNPSEYEADEGYRSGMDRAVDMCVEEVEQGRERVASVDSAARGGDGWFVSGEVDSGAPFTCRIGNDGRIGEVEVGDDWSGGSQADAEFDQLPFGPVVDNQYDDRTYAQARAAITPPVGY